MSITSLSTSSMTIADIYQQEPMPSYPERHGDRLYYLRAQLAEKGRVSLEMQCAGGEPEVLVPAPYQLRSSVHEYGGRCFCLDESAVYFNDFNSGQLMSLGLQGASSVRLLSIKGQYDSQFVDLFKSPKSDYLVCIQETKLDDTSEPRSAIVALDVRSDTPQQSQILCEGADFYACPRVSADGTKLAWFEWNHPDMPWDRAILKVADLVVNAESSIKVRQVQTVIDQVDTSVSQIGWLDDMSLVFAMDSESQFWNLYCWKNGVLQALTHEIAEYGEAHWTFGQSRWVQMDADTLLAIRSQPSKDELVKVYLDGRTPEVVLEGLAQCSQLSINQDRSEAVFVAHYTDKSPELMALELNSGLTTSLFSLPSLLHQEEVSLPQALDYPTQDGQIAHGFYYPPNDSNQGLELGTNQAEAPPLIVMVHGGPTGRSRAEFALLKQFFTTSGFAVLDVNHRGSTGYGRAYRQALLGEWGKIDAADIADGVHYLVAQGLANAQQVFIRGGSAGGYAVLRALTRFPDLFMGGACYYGIGNLITLSEITHKFEAHYTDQLIGEVFDSLASRAVYSEYVQRSPIFDIDQIKAPVILFQGLDDKVVPPEVSREVVRTLKQNHIPHEYVEYEGEGHGFRQKHTRIDALKREMNFYANIIEVARDVERN